MTQQKIILDVKNLTLAFKQKQTLINIIRGISFKVLDSQIIGLVGESGSGKSVTTKALLNLNVGAITNAEKMTIDDIDLTKVKKQDWRKIRGKKITYIPQDPMTSLNPTRTIKKQLLDTLEENRPDIKGEEKLKYIVEILENFGIRNAAKLINQYPHTFSGGMKQRIVVASAVMCNPSLIIADEPTTALDTVVQASVLNLFQKIRDQYKVSIAFISHDISVVSKLCDYVYVMYAGKIVEQGTKEDIFGDPRHPYTWALMASMPEDQKGNVLVSIPGSPPDMKFLRGGDPFAPRNAFATKLDFIKEPPLFEISPSHSAATWLLAEGAPKVEIPKATQSKIKAFRKAYNEK